MSDVPETRYFDPHEAAPHGAAEPSLFAALWRFRWQVALTVIIAALAGYGLSLLLSTTYKAEAELLLSDPRDTGIFDEGSGGFVNPDRYVRNQAQFAGSSQVAARALELMPEGHGLSVKDVTEEVTVTPSANLDLLTITATQPTASGSALLANAIAEAYQQLVREQVQSNATQAIAELEESKQSLTARVEAVEANLEADPDNAALQAERDGLVAQRVTLDTRIEQINVNMALYGSGVQHFEVADAPTSRSTPRPTRNAAVAAVLGLLSAGAYAWWRAESTPLAQNRHDPAPILQAPLLAEIPEFATTGVDSPAPTIFEPMSAPAEAYQFLVSSLDFALKQNEGSTVLITSPRKGDGKTTTALNMSVAAVSSGTPALLVDADERARGLSLTGLLVDARCPSLTGDRDQALGLTDLAQRDDLEVADCVQRWKVSDEHALSVLPAGSRVESTGGFFRSPGFRKVMTTLRSSAPVVLFDSAPVLAASEASDIASQVDGIVLVVARGTPLALLEETRSRLEMTGKPLLGYVFNRAVPGGGRYGYSGYYG
ncbi:MAG: lipopolysaccharide biosynthesis protein [Actinobacteria bacterium]|nr:lipopolysaccharide biosynthesis protein [Actinomycetota bacterium]